jgi:hypothetical protein
MAARISKFLIGVLAIPVVIGVTLAFFGSLANIGAERYAGSRVFLYGVVSYVLVHLFLHKFEYVYTFGHEVTHVLATWLCGGSVKSFNVSKKGGAVETTKSNFFIALSPYFVPTYTLILSALYFVIPLFVKIRGLNTVYCYLGGFTLALHLVFTAEVLKIKQPDLVKTGYVFSLALVYIVNILLVAFIMSLLFKDVSFVNFFGNTYTTSKNIYVRIFRQLF